MIVSPNEINDHLRTVVIAPMTSTNKRYPTRVNVKHNNQEGWIVLEQLRTVDKIRILRKLGNLTEKEIKECKRVIKETYID